MNTSISKTINDHIPIRSIEDQAILNELIAIRERVQPIQNALPRMAWQDARDDARKA
jgi:hypothetical protein